MILAFDADIRKFVCGRRSTANAILEWVLFIHLWPPQITSPFRVVYHRGKGRSREKREREREGKNAGYKHTHKVTERERRE